jgi:hypothetical protein
MWRPRNLGPLNLFDSMQVAATEYLCEYLAARLRIALDSLEVRFFMHLFALLVLLLGWINDSLDGENDEKLHHTGVLNLTGGSLRAQ